MCATDTEKARISVPLTVPPNRCAALTKRYADVVAVAGLDLTVNVRECFGLLGPNGAGKTTTIEILEGLTAPDRGEVEILGMRWTRGSSTRALRRSEERRVGKECRSRWSAYH